MLKVVRLKDFKSFKLTDPLPLAPLTFLIGANASGKSNFLDALRFLQGISFHMPLTEIFRGRSEGGREIWPGIRGGVAEVARSGTKSFGLRSLWQINGISVDHLIHCKLRPEPLVTRERLWDKSGRYWFDSAAKTLGAGKGLGAGGTLTVALRRVGQGKSLSQKYSAHRSVVGQVEALPSLAPKVLEAQTHALAAFGSMLFLDLNPRKMRDYVPKHIRELGAEGQHLSSVLFDLARNPERKKSLVDWLSALCAPEVKDIDFVETELGDVMLKLIEGDGKELSIRSLSDGTLRFLGTLAAVLTARPGTVLLIEEIENGLHPSRVHLMAEFLEKLTAKRGFQVIATTHSPLLLHRLKPETLSSALLFARSDQSPGSVIRRLGALPDFESLVKKKGFEYLFTTRWLERAL